MKNNLYLQRVVRGCLIVWFSMAISSYAQPVLHPDTTDNDINHRIGISFDESSIWAASIREIRINDRVAHFTYYEISDTCILLWPDLFTDPGEYKITVKPIGYEPSILVQELLPGGTWENELLSFVPGDNTINVNPNANLVFTFSEDVVLGEGDIRIFKIEYKTDSMLYERINARSDRVTGNGSKVITIDPEKILSSGSYFIQVDDNFFGENYKGFNTTYDWNLSSYFVLEEILPGDSLGHDVRIAVSLPSDYRADGTETYTGIFTLDAPWWWVMHWDSHKMYRDGDIPEDPVYITIGSPWEQDIIPTRELDYTRNYRMFYRYLKNHLVPYLSGIYHLDPLKRTMIGASHGGRMTLYSFLRSCLDRDTSFYNFCPVSPSYTDYTPWMSVLSQRNDSLGKHLINSVGEFDLNVCLETHKVVNDWLDSCSFTHFNFYDEIRSGAVHDDAYPAILFSLKIALNMPDPYVEFSKYSYDANDTVPYVMIRRWPEDGILSGPGVRDSAFIPLKAGPGTHTLTYSYTDQQGITYSKEVQMEVLPTGINMFTMPEIELFPNPTKDKVNLVLNVPGWYALEIISSTGQVVLRETFMDREHQTDLTPITRGLYYIRIRSQANVWTGKVLKY